MVFPDPTVSALGLMRLSMVAPPWPQCSRLARCARPVRELPVLSRFGHVARFATRDEHLRSARWLLLAPCASIRHAHTRHCMVASLVLAGHCSCLPLPNYFTVISWALALAISLTLCQVVSLGRLELPGDGAVVARAYKSVVFVVLFVFTLKRFQFPTSLLFCAAHQTIFTLGCISLHFAPDGSSEHVFDVGILCCDGQKT